MGKKKNRNRPGGGNKAETQHEHKKAPGKGGKGRKGSKSKNSMLAVAGFIALALVVYYFASGSGGPGGAGEAGGYGKTASAASSAPAVDAQNLRGGETKPTINPAMYVGKIATAYRIAQGNRELLDSMFCYCYCKRMGHKSLLSCYTDQHAANCSICMDQAIYAYKLSKQGLSIPEVRKMMDKKFWRPLRS